MTAADLAVSRFRCGHEKAGANIQRDTIRGKLYERCHACHRAAKASWYRWWKSL